MPSTPATSRLRLQASAATALALVAVLAAPASGATLTVTPDRSTYQVGDTITLDVVGDPEGMLANSVFGFIVFDAEVASYQASHQQPLTEFGRPWTLGTLTGGVDFAGRGFADVFSQFGGLGGSRPENELIASVTLMALSEGVLEFDWGFDFQFFDVPEPPIPSVLIVPEPSTLALAALGMLGTALAWRRRGPGSARPRHRSGSPRAARARQLA